MVAAADKEAATVFICQVARLPMALRRPPLVLFLLADVIGNCGKQASEVCTLRKGPKKYGSA